jgi:hypothetical protein
MNRLAFPQGLNNVGRLHLVDNAFKTIEGLNFKEAAHVELRSLTQLSSISLPNLEKVQDTLFITLNNPSLSVAVRFHSIVFK